MSGRETPIRGLNDQVTRNLEDLRVLRHVPVAEFAGALGMAEGSYYRRRRSGPAWSVDELEAAARVLGVGIATLLAEELLPHQDSNLKPADYPGRTRGRPIISLDGVDYRPGGLEFAA